MKPTKLKILLFLFSIFLSCDFPTETEKYIEERYPLCLVDIDGQNKIELQEDGFKGAQLYFVSDDKEILVIWGDSFYRINESDKKLVYKFRIPLKIESECLLSPDKNFVVFTASENDSIDIYRISIDGTNLQRLTFSSDIYEQHISFSQDGSKLIFTTRSTNINHGQSITIYDFNYDKSSILLEHPDDHRVVNPIKYYWYPVFVNNNSKVVFLKPNENRALDDSLLLYNLLDSTLLLLDDKATVTKPIKISSMANSFIYGRMNAYIDLIIRNIQTNNSSEIGNDLSYYVEYLISSDEQTILLWGNETNDEYIYKINSNDLDMKRFIRGRNPSLCSNNRRIVYSGYVKIVH